MIHLLKYYNFKKRIYTLYCKQLVFILFEKQDTEKENNKEKDK